MWQPFAIAGPADYIMLCVWPNRVQRHRQRVKKSRPLHDVQASSKSAKTPGCTRDCRREGVRHAKDRVASGLADSPEMPPYECARHVVPHRNGRIPRGPASGGGPANRVARHMRDCAANRSYGLSALRQTCRDVGIQTEKLHPFHHMIRYKIHKKMSSSGYA